MVRGRRNTNTQNDVDKQDCPSKTKTEGTKASILKNKADCGEDSGTRRKKRKSDVDVVENKGEGKEVGLKKSKVSTRIKSSVGDKLKNGNIRGKVKQEVERTVKKEPAGESDVAKKPVGQKTRKVSKQAAKSAVKIKSQPKCASLPAISKFNLSSHKCAKRVGAHVSIAGGLYNAVDAAVFHGAKAFGLFLKSQRQWNSKPLLDKDAEKFRNAYQEAGFSPGDILPHGSYLMNCGSSNPETLQKSRDTLVDELQRCEKLGLTLYNFHPGSSCGNITTDQSLALIAESINMAHTKTKFVITVIENMSCQGSTVGGKFQELREIIDKVKNKARIGVCLDTCHAFAAGHDLSSQSGFEKMMAEFGTVVGFQYLKAMHLNDSKGTVGCHLDRHENIGRGHIGIEGFRRVMCDPRFNNMPMILETPPASDDIYTKEIKLLHSICKS
ncbi:probable endonuclease 4 [Ylistrum balloti]|uniref:probable endonuclease 4 n=1 Tax=Ylistrum balloti TaxID=509963 RepID=UPI002905E8FD|nr:probable endonuclease 4 [Ylistrum balloti]